MSDNVFNPQHYNMGKYETIDVIEDIIRFYSNPVHAAMVFQVIKYLARAPHKGNYVEDIKKATWYMNRLEQKVEWLEDHPGDWFMLSEEYPECKVFHDGCHECKFADREENQEPCVWCECNMINPPPDCKCYYQPEGKSGAE